MGVARRKFLLSPGGGCRRFLLWQGEGGRGSNRCGQTGDEALGAAALARAPIPWRPNAPGVSTSKSLNKWTEYQLTKSKYKHNMQAGAGALFAKRGGAINLNSVERTL